MPLGKLGQLITFSIDLSADEQFSQFIWIRAKHGDTVAKIAARRGHPEQARAIAELNHIRGIHRPLKKGERLRIPGTLKKGDVVHVLPDSDKPPIVQGGYAKFDTVAVPGRKGISRFIGYDPIPFDVPLQWEAFVSDDGQSVEDAIRTLERMAGRGHFSGSAVGPPAVIRVSVTDNHGNVVPLIPTNYQWTPSNPTAPLWRISNIAWGGGARRNGAGRRIRESAVVSLVEYTPIHIVERSVTKRAKRNPGDNKKKAA